VQIASGNVLRVGGDVTIGREGRLAITVRGNTDYTAVRASGDLILDGELDLDVQGSLTPGTVLTILSGSSISGKLHKLPENRVLNEDGYLFRVSYKNNSVTLTVLRALPRKAH
jgi:subtilase-type serine protease